MKRAAEQMQIFMKPGHKKDYIFKPWTREQEQVNMLCTRDLLHLQNTIM